MKWLVAEDALRDRKGHWFEYLSTFARESRALGDDVTILADHSAEQFLVDQLHVQPVLPYSIWSRMGDQAGPFRRYLRVPVHAWQTFRSVKKYLQSGEKFDVIFVPTMLVHHLLGWVWLIKQTLARAPTRVLLFFPNTPVQLDLNRYEPSWQPAPTAKLFCRLIHSLQNEVKQGRVILGAETEPMRAAMTRLTGVPFTYFPHPATPLVDESPASNPQASSLLTLASYGSARHEKGSDLLVAAVQEYCRRHPDSRVRFVLQSVDGDGRLWEQLRGNSKVRLIPDYFADGEYARQLREANVMLLPYRRSSYGLRVSRVVIEAMIHGIPVVVTRGTTLAEQAEQFGAAVMCENGNVESLVNAIQTVERDYEALRTRACEQRIKAQEHFSVAHFRNSLCRTQNGIGNRN